MWFTYSHGLFIKKIIELGLLVSIMWTVWYDTDGYAMAVYLITVLSYLYVIIMYYAINASGNRNNVFDGLDGTDKCYLKEHIELLVKLASDDTSKIGIHPIASKDVSINFSWQCLHILINNERLNGPKRIITI